MVDVERSERKHSRVMVVIELGIRAREPVGVLEALRAEGLDAVLYDRAQVEPADVSLQEAAACAADGGFDGYVRLLSARLPVPRVASGPASAGQPVAPALRPFTQQMPAADLKTARQRLADLREE